MKKLSFLRSVLVFIGASLAVATPVIGQKARPKAAVKAPKPVIFAVLNDGTTLEPIAYAASDKLTPAVHGDDPQNQIATFNKTYYKPGAAYALVFGGAKAGVVTVKSSDVKAECSRNMGVAGTRSDKTPLKGLIMGLATNAPIKAGRVSFRRKPTTEEREEIEALVKAEYSKQKVSPKALRYHNLTGLDLDGDGAAEFVGSYWTELDKLSRGLIFFIARKGLNGKYEFGHSEYRKVDQADVMSGDITSIDDGVYHELLLDVYDYDGDGRSEVFTYIQAFEGATFNVYRESKGTWSRVFEDTNYHCGY